MCGICGVAGLSDESVVKRMLSYLTHRGPDDEGVFSSREGSLGVRRLSIVDVSGGHQPFLSEDGTKCLVFNGEIYNFQQLKHDLLQKHSFSTSTDGEVILHLYEDFPEKFVNYLNGMFAFALLDTEKRRLILARDSLGIKPMHYYIGEHGELVFGSEVKAILGSNLFEPTINTGAFSDLLFYHFIPVPYTMFNEVSKLPPGCMLIWDNYKSNLVPFWTLPRAEYRGSFYGASAQILGKLRMSVSQAVLADVPVGVFLSGGLDSAAILALATQYLPKLQTFTFGFSEDDSSIRQSRVLAEKFGTDHNEIICSLGIFEVLDEVAWHLEEPILNTANFPTFILSKAVSGRAKTVLVGEGSDELFGGYLRYRMLHKLQRALDLGAKPSTSKTSLDPADYAFRGRLYRTWDGERAFRGKVTVPGSRIGLEPSPSEGGPADLVRASQRFDILYDLPEFQLLRVDRMTMAHGVEARVPFLLPDLVTFSYSLPTSYKIRDSANKAVLREAMRHVLPRGIAEEPKRPFSTPIAFFSSRDFVVQASNAVMSSELLVKTFERDWLNRVIAGASPTEPNRCLQLLLLALTASWYLRFTSEFPTIQLSVTRMI